MKTVSLDTAKSEKYICLSSSESGRTPLTAHSKLQINANSPTDRFESDLGRFFDWAAAAA